jgi:hypothetical protein
VATAYVQIRTTERQIAIAQDNITRQRTALKIARAKFQYGTATRRDVYQAENVLGATEATIPQLNVQLAQAKNALSVLLGMPPGPLDDLLTGPADIPTAPERAIVGIPADLLCRHRREHFALYRAGFDAQGCGDQGDGRAHGAGAGYYVSIDGGVFTGVVFTGNHRADVSPVCVGDSGHGDHQRHQCLDVETDPVRAVFAAGTQGQTVELVLSVSGLGSTTARIFPDEFTPGDPEKTSVHS